MEESKELQGFYRIFRAVVYVSVLMEFFEYAIDPAMLDHWGGILCDIHGRIKRWAIYNDGNLVYSKVATVLLICITCIGTRAKKHFGIQRPAAGLVPARERLCPVSAVRMAVRSSDGDAVLHAAAEHYSLYGGIAHGGYPRACRTG